MERKPATQDVSSQLTELPGELWEDIFWPPPKPPTAKQMTGADWDAMLGRSPSRPEKETP